MHKQSTSDQNHCSAIREHVIGCFSMQDCNRPHKSDKKGYFADDDKM